MASTKFGIVYGNVTNIIRRVIEPDDDSYLSSIVLKPGESLLQLDLIDHPVRTVLSLQASVGPQRQSSRCAKIDNSGNVVDIIQADPTIDPAIGVHTIVQSDLAQKNDKLVGGRLRRDFAIANNAGIVTAIVSLPIDAVVATPGTRVFPATARNKAGQHVPVDAVPISDGIGRGP